jgi:hypothetical protein
MLAAKYVVPEVDILAAQRVGMKTYPQWHAPGVQCRAQTNFASTNQTETVSQPEVHLQVSAAPPFTTV